MELSLKKPLSALLAGLFLLGTLAAYTRAQDAAAVMNKGLDWLKVNQKPSGAWSDENYPALTALGLWAVARSGREDLKETADKAAVFVAGFAQPDGSIYKPAGGGRGSGGLSTYNTAICMVVLQELDAAKYAPAILKAREFMVGAQVQGDSPGAGGFGYGRPGESPRDRPDLSNTAWALMAMRRTQAAEDRRPAGAQRADIRWDAALAFVEKLQNRDADDATGNGGFGYESGGERGGTTTSQGGAVTLRGFGSMTYAGIESMIYAQVGPDDPRVRSAIAWAGRHWSVEENPGMGTRGLFYYYTILAKSLRLVGGDGVLKNQVGEPIPWRADLTKKLVATQRPDGSWANEDNTFWEGDPALVTSYALLVLQDVAGGR